MSADQTMFNIAFRFRHCNGMSTLTRDMAFLYPPEFGDGVGTLSQQRHGWIAFQMPTPGADRWAATRSLRGLTRALWDRWLLEPHLPPEAKMTEVQLDPGFGEPFSWGSGRLVECNVCQAQTHAGTANQGRTWMLAHPTDHTDTQIAELSKGIHHYTLHTPTNTTNRKGH